MTVNEFIEKYKSENFSSYLKENATIDYWNDLIKTFKIERLNFVFPDTLVLNPRNVLNENGSPFNVQFDGFCERQIKILEIENCYSNNDNIQVNNYLKSYNQISFDEVSNKRNEDTTLNKWYSGDFFNEWLNDINRSLNSNKYFDNDTLDKSREYNKNLCNLGTSIIKLYKVVSSCNRDGENSSNTAFYLQEKQVLKNLEVIRYYSDLIKIIVRNNEYKKGNNFKEYCLDLLNNFIYNLNHILTIDIYKSPLKLHFDDLKQSLSESINLEELSLLNQLDQQNNLQKKETNILLKLNLQLHYFYGRISLAIMQNQRVHFLICSDENLFDIQKLKQYFIDNTLNDFAKSEIDKFVELTDELKILNQKYSSLPNPLIFHQYEYQNSRGGTNSGSVRGALEYYHYHDNEISHLTENGFKNRSQKSKNILSFNTNQLFYKCKDIQDLCVDYEQPRLNEASKSSKSIKGNSLTIRTQKEFKDFFNADVESEVVDKIANDFQDYYGKKMAILIYLLEKEFDLIKYSLDSKTDSRKHFVDSLNKSKINMQPVNKCFVTHSYKLDIRNFEKDKVFLTIKEKLEKTIK